MNPLHYVPVFVDDNVVVSDSYAIFMVGLVLQALKKLVTLVNSTPETNNFLSSDYISFRSPFLDDGLFQKIWILKMEFEWENYLVVWNSDA